MSISLTTLRTKLFGCVDEVIKTGVPLEIKRKGQIVKIVVEKKKSKLKNLGIHHCIIGNDDMVDLNLSCWNGVNKFKDL